MADVTNPETAKPPRYRAKLIAIVVALLLIYAASPYYSIWRFGEALRAHDMDALAAQIDFDAVRGSLKQQIRDHFLGVLAKKKKDRLAQFLTASTDNPLDRLIDAYVTPEGLPPSSPIPRRSRTPARSQRFPASTVTGRKSIGRKRGTPSSPARAISPSTTMGSSCASALTASAGNCTPSTCSCR